MARFIALEGLHGVGKSTVAQLVARQVGVELTPTIPDEFGVSRKHVNEASSLEARYMLFLAATFSAGEHIQQKCKAGLDVVVESYIFRTIAFHEGMGSLVTINVPKGLFLPTHTILLTCAAEVRALRLEGRGGLRSKWDVRAESMSEKIAQRYAEFNFPIVDTTTLEPHEVATKIMEIVDASS